MRVILIKGRSAYDVLRLFIDELAQAFARAGLEPVVVDAAAEPDLPAALIRAGQTGGVRLVFTFGILGEFRDGEGRSVGDLVGAPHVIQYVDYPLTHWPALDRTSPKAALLFIDRSHPAAVKAAYGEGRFAHLGFSPHAATGPIVAPGADPDDFARARPIPILFPGSVDPPNTEPWEALPEQGRRILGAAFDTAAAQEWMPALNAVDLALAAFGFSPADPRMAPLRKAAALVHERLRAHRRMQLLEAAARLGIALHACGRGYEPLLGRWPNLVHHGETRFAETQALMARSRVVLNVNANFGAGSHERPLSAMNAGAAAASDHSSFYASSFLPGRDIALYRWSDLDVGLMAVAALSQDAQAAFAMAAAGQARALREHQWDHRIPAILAAADEARARQAD